VVSGLTGYPAARESGEKVALLMLVACALLWSTSGFMIKTIQLNPLSLAGIRSAFSALTLTVLVRKLRFTWSIYQLLGAVFYAATVILFVSATKLTTAANAILLQYTAPVYTALFGGWFLNERAGWYDWIIIFIVMGGMALFFLDRLTPLDYAGNALAIVSGVTTAWLGLLMRKQKKGSPVETIILGNAITAFVGVPFAVGSLPALTDLYRLLYLGIVQLGLSFFLYSLAIRRVRALDAMLILTLEPVLNPIWVFLAVGEKPGFFSVVGGSVVIAAVTSRTLFVALSGREG
jgi:drug/metabolite transporter (DMT)-like permease